MVPLTVRFSARSSASPWPHPWGLTTTTIVPFFLPDTSAPSGTLYSLTEPEWKTIDTYMNASLAVGLICPSSSPAAAGLFFISKKDGTLKPYIDYSGLNSNTIKNRYPPPSHFSCFWTAPGIHHFQEIWPKQRLQSCLTWTVFTHRTLWVPRHQCTSCLPSPN